MRFADSEPTAASCAGNLLPQMSRHLIGGIRGYVCCPAGRWCVSTDQAAANHHEHVTHPVAKEADQ